MSPTCLAREFAHSLLAKVPNRGNVGFSTADFGPPDASEL